MKAKNLPTKEEFFKPVLSVFDIDENTKPNWENEKYKFFVVRHSKDFRVILTVVYNKEPFEPKTYLVFKDTLPWKDTSQLESAGILFELCVKLCKEEK